MEEQDLDVQKPFYKKAWFWLVIIIVCNICMSLYNAVLVWIGVADGGVTVELVNDKYESFSYLNNGRPVNPCSIKSPGANFRIQAVIIAQ